MNVFDILLADHQRAAQVLAKNLHAERGEKPCAALDHGDEDPYVSQQTLRITDVILLITTLSLFLCFSHIPSSIHPFLMPASSSAQGHGGQIEPITAVIGQRQVDTLDKWTVIYRSTLGDKQPFTLVHVFKYCRSRLFSRCPQRWWSIASPLRLSKPPIFSLYGCGPWWFRSSLSSCWVFFI